jgi:hypothetical protein
MSTLQGFISQFKRLSHLSLNGTKLSKSLRQIKHITLNTSLKELDLNFSKSKLGDQELELLVLQIAKLK